MRVNNCYYYFLYHYKQLRQSPTTASKEQQSRHWRNSDPDRHALVEHTHGVHILLKCREEILAGYCLDLIHQSALAKSDWMERGATDDQSTLQSTGLRTALVENSSSLYTAQGSCMRTFRWSQQLLVQAKLHSWIFAQRQVHSIMTTWCVQCEETAATAVSVYIIA